LSRDLSGTKHKLIDRFSSGYWRVVIIIAATRRFRALLVRRRLNTGQSIQCGINVLAWVVVIMRPQ